MNDYRVAPLSLLLLTLADCQSLPGFSRSGDVRDIAIGDRLSAAFAEVQAGDEIRWTNKRTTSVQIIFLDYVLDALSCRSNFTGHFYSGAEADLQPNERAGLCFHKPGTIRYIVRMWSDLRHGDIADFGQVQVGAFSEHPSARNESIAPP